MVHKWKYPHNEKYDNAGDPKDRVIESDSAEVLYDLDPGSGDSDDIGSLQHFQTKKRADLSWMK